MWHVSMRSVPWFSWSHGKFVIIEGLPWVERFRDESLALISVVQAEKSNVYMLGESSRVGLIAQVDLLGLKQSSEGEI